MRYLLIFILWTCLLPAAFSQPVTPASKATWDQVEALLQEGRPASALPLAESLLKSARQSNNSVQVVKALFYVFRCKADFTEDTYLEYLRLIDEEIGKAEEPLVQILRSIRAQLQWTYFLNVRWQIESRKALVDTVQADPRFWDARRFTMEIARDLKRSLHNAALLKNVKREKFEGLLTGDQDLQYIYPTLFDFLAHRALEFLGQSAMPGSAEKLSILENPDLWGASEQFVRLAPPATATESPLSEALVVLRELTAFHLEDGNLNALTAADLWRFRFLEAHGRMPRKPWLYKAALQRVIAARPTTLHTAEAGYLLAQWYLREGSRYKPAYNKAPDSTAFYLYLAAGTCKATMKAFPKSAGAARCSMLLSTLQNTHLNLILPRLARKGKPTLAALSFKNLKKVHVRILKAAPEAWQTFLDRESPYDRSHAARYLSTQNTVYRETLTLPDDSLLHMHTTYFRVPALEEGFYVVVAMSGEGNLAGDRTSDFCFAPLYSTDVTCVSETQNNSMRLRVWNSLTDLPQPGVTVKMYRQVYNYQKHRYEKEFVSSGTTDEEGLFKFEGAAGGHESYHYEVIRNQISIRSEMLYLRERYEPPQPEAHITFFTDRSLYRPGQTLAFKALALSSEPVPYTRLLTGYSTQVQLRDPNNRVVFEHAYTTGEFGSFWGQIPLPVKGLTGVYTLWAGRSMHQIRVEEYKMPRFEITLKPQGPAGLLGGDVEVEGACRTLAGFALSGVPVRYRVTRHLMKRWFFYRGGGPLQHEEGEEIASGFLEPDEKGKFLIRFRAEPDERKAADSAAAYEFLIQAECTDMTGETRTAELSLRYSYTPLMAEISAPPVCFKNRRSSLAFQLSSLNEAKASGLVRLVVREARPKGRMPLPSLLPEGDVRLIPSSEFVKDFPQHLNVGETEDSLVETGMVVLDTVLYIQDRLEVHDNRLRAFKAGLYHIELTTLPEKGRRHKAGKLITLAESDQSGAYLYGPPLLVVPLTRLSAPGEPVGITLATLKPCRLYAEIVSAPLQSRFNQKLEAGKAYARLTVPGQESREPGWRMLFTTCAEGRILQKTVDVSVADPAKEIRLQWLNVPDTVEPGREYLWRFRAVGGDGRPASDCEVAAVMYDAALDKLYPHMWSFALKQAPLPAVYSRLWSEETAHGYCLAGEKPVGKSRDFRYPALNTYDFYLAPFEYSDDNNYFLDGYIARQGRAQLMEATVVNSRTPAGRKKGAISAEDLAEETGNDVPPSPVPRDREEQKEENFKGGEPGKTGSVMRSRFVETAFFFPDVHTGPDGIGEFRFRMPDQITGYTLRLAAHNRALATGLEEKNVQSQKKLMVNTFVPRFLREGDDLVFTAKVTNLNALPETVSVLLEISNAENERSLTSWRSPEPLIIKPGENRQLRMPLSVPGGVKALKLRILAQGRRLSDGEEWLVPVLPSEILVTDSYPFHVKRGASITLDLEKITDWQSGKLPHIRPVQVTAELTDNPLWLVVQALPYMAEFPYECAEQLFARYFSYVVVRHLVSQNQRLKQTVEYWKNFQPEALLSSLEKNSGLKNILLEETPWLQEAQSETRQKQMLAYLMEAVLYTDVEKTAAQKLAARQKPDGGWGWFEGGPSSWYITQHILSGIGRMEHLGLLTPGQHPLASRIHDAVRFIDKELRDDYEAIKKLIPSASKDTRWLSPIHAHYLYTRSYFKTQEFSEKSRTAHDFFLKRAQEEWQQQNPYVQAMLALAFHRLGDTDMQRKIITSLRERAIRSEEYGMYWKGMMQGGFLWSEHPIEAMAMLMDAFKAAGAGDEELASMQLWLLRHKQTNRWASTKATTEACLTLLNGNTRLTESSSSVQSWLGDLRLNDLAESVEAGTGYLQVTRLPEQLPRQAGRLKVEAGSSVLSWGAVYFQYYTPLEKVEAAADRFLSIDREIWAEPAPGQPLRKLENGSSLSVGQRVFVRLRISCSQPMDYIHIRDRRSAAMEPEDVLSGFRWKESLGYYQSTRDAATHFFVEHMPRGAFVFEYPVRITHAGRYNDGFAEMQCMYAPEFSSRSASAVFSVSE